MLQPLGRAVWSFLKKLALELSYESATPLLSIYSKKAKTLIRKDTCIPMFIAVLFTVVKIWKQPNCSSVGEWMKKWFIYMQWNITQPSKRTIFCQL